MYAFLQGVDLIWFSMILIACRPRREWPAFFNIGVNDMNAQLNRGRAEGLAPQKATPIISESITQGFLKDYYDSNTTQPDSICSEDAIIFVNPTKYTIDPAELQANQDFNQLDLSNEIKVENPYTALINKVKIDYSEVNAFTILAESHIASKDKKQVI